MNKRALLFSLLGASVVFLIVSRTEKGRALIQSGIDYGVEFMGKISQAGLDLIKGFEGFSAKPYRDANGYSIGYGHFILPGEKIAEVDTVEAELLLASDTAKAQAAINTYVKVPLSQNQYDALVSFVYNVGVGAFKTSTALKRLNMGDYKGAADAMTWFNKSQGQILQALVNRRAAERDLFLS